MRSRKFSYCIRLHSCTICMSVCQPAAAHLSFSRFFLCLSPSYLSTHRSVEISLPLTLHLSVSAHVSALGLIINLRWNSEPFSMFTSPVCVCVCVCVFVCACLLSVSVCVCVCVCARVYVSAFHTVSAYIYMRVCVCAFLCVCVTC